MLSGGEAFLAPPWRTLSVRHGFGVFIGQESLNRRGRRWYGEHITLRPVAAHGLQSFELLPGLHSLSHCPHA